MYLRVDLVVLLVQKATKVYGIEIVKDAIKDARLNNLDFYVGKAEEVLPNIYLVIHQL